MRFILTAIVAAAIWAGAPGPTATAEDDPHFLTLAVGYYDFNDDWGAAEFRAEFRARDKFWIFKPLGGMMATSDAAFYGYAGVLVDLYFGRRIVVTPSFAAGLYADGDGKNLGQTVQFRSAIEVAYRFDNRARLGLSLYHLSNASFNDDNQGTEVLSLSYSIPLGHGK